MARLQGSTGRPLGSGEDHHLRVRRRNTRLCLIMQSYCGFIVCDNPITMVKRACMLEQLSSSARLSCSGQILRDLSGQFHRELSSGKFSCHADMKELPEKLSASAEQWGGPPPHNGYGGPPQDMNGGQNHVSFGGAPAGRKKALICACNYK